MASARIQAGQLDSTISKILEEYHNEIDKDVGKAIDKVAKAGVKELKANSRTSFKGTGKYAKGWTSKKEKDRILHTTIIYNKTPGLPHLLEHGHAKRGGGRVDGREHIAPVEKEVIEQFEKELINEIQ